VAGNTDLACKNGVRANFATAANGILSDYNAMFVDDDIVGDLYQVINLGASADFGVSERAPIDSAVGPNLDVIFDDDSANLWDFPMVILIENIAKSIRSDHGSGVNANAIAQFAFAVNTDVGEQPCSLANR
jgi:hypothetical protein